jgi:hypothetical protein
MHRLPLILCAIALLGSAISSGLYLQIGNSKQLLEQRLNDAQGRTAKLESDLANVNEQNGALKARALHFSGELEAAKTSQANLTGELETAKAATLAERARLDQLNRDLTDTKSVLALYEATTRALGDEVAALRADLDDSRNSNASPEAVLAYKTTIAELERQLATARNGAALTSGAGGATAVFASRAGRATVLTVGPESAFVVLNFGAERGAQLGQKMTVSQGSEIVATILISDVRSKFSVAQVLPDTLRGVLQKGDPAVLLR